MRKSIGFLGLIIISTAMVVASPRTEYKDFKSDHTIVLTNHGYSDLFIQDVACLNDHFVPMVQGGKLLHVESIVTPSDGYSPLIMAMIRGPTISKMNLLPYIRDKDGK